MAKSVHNNILDAALNYIKNNSAEICMCSQEPTTYAQATSSYMLAKKALVSGDFGSPADGDTSGRKIAVPEVSAVSPSSSGDVTHVAIVSGSLLLYVTTCNTYSISTGTDETIPTWDIEIADPN